MRIKQRHLLAALLLLPFSVLPFLSGCGHAPVKSGAAASQNGLLRVGYVSPYGSLPSGPEGWENRSGKLVPQLRTAGVTAVKFTAFPNGPDLNEALAANAIDLAMIGDTPGILGRAAGIPTHLVNQSTVGSNAWLMVRADGPRTLADLKGKTVATAKGSYMSRYLLGLLAEAGLSKDVKFVHLLPSDAEPALRRGDIAAYAHPYGPLLISHGFRAIDQARQHPGLEGSGLTLIRDAYLTAHPGFPALWNKARKTGIADILAQQNDYYQVQAKNARLPVPIFKAMSPVSLYQSQPLTPKGLALLDGTKAFLVDQHLAKQDFSIHDWTAPSEAATAVASQEKL